MAEYRSKPVVIEAVQLTAQRMASIKVGSERAPNGLILLVNHGLFRCCTRQGDVIASEGDWIIQESDGSGCYPCKPDVFAAKYEPIP